jgi:hypothetical protein
VSGRTMQCDEAQDCDAGQLCCAEFGTNGISSSCQSSGCGSSDLQPCKTNAECDGGTCAEYTCPAIGTVRSCRKANGCN